MTDNLPAMRYSPIPSEHEMAVFSTMAKQAVDSKMYRNIGDQAGVMMIMLAAREMGMSPMMALNGGLNIIQGKVEISARMMNAMIRRAGHSISIKESSDEKCVLVGRRGDTGDTATVSYTLVEAQKAGLVKPGGGWAKNPKDMCFARAISRLARQLFADVIGIGYVEGEISASDVKPTIPTDIPVEEVIVEDVEPYLQKIYDLLKDEPQHLVKSYIETVMKHFEWSLIETVKQMLLDPQKLVEKYLAWKSKQKIGE